MPHSATEVALDRLEFQYLFLKKCFDESIVVVVNLPDESATVVGFTFGVQAQDGLVDGVGIGEALNAAPVMVGEAVKNVGESVDCARDRFPVDMYISCGAVGKDEGVKARRLFDGLMVYMCPHRLVLAQRQRQRNGIGITGECDLSSGCVWSEKVLTEDAPVVKLRRVDLCADGFGIGGWDAGQEVSWQIGDPVV
ncbi:MAG: hypothetical protein OXG49_18240 [Chloroflexi bacterium]|nr:hypothetical protein [Chloroflexota bacterium]